MLRHVRIIICVLNKDSERRKHKMTRGLRNIHPENDMTNMMNGKKRTNKEILEYDLKTPAILETIIVRTQKHLQHMIGENNVSILVLQIK